MKKHPIRQFTRYPCGEDFDAFECVDESVGWSKGILVAGLFGNVAESYVVRIVFARARLGGTRR